MFAHASPGTLGYVMLPEWVQHRATWLAWPHERNDWPGKFPAIPFVYAEIVRHLSASEQVNILVNDAQHKKNVQHLLREAHADLSRVKLFLCRTNRSWIRDTGPIFVGNRSRDVVATSWHFNGWGKYGNWRRDQAISSFVAAATRKAAFVPKFNGKRLVLEGGAIDTDGEGTLLATEECLLSKVQERNPGVSRQDLEKIFLNVLGTKRVLWLGRGIVGDDTHGHVDDFCRFVGPGRVLLAYESNHRDPNAKILEENRRRLQTMRDARGRRLEVMRLPMPTPVFFGGERLPASYANFYISNQKVLVPTFNDPKDREALGILAELFPGRTVVGIHAVDLVLGLGTLHCLTRDEPLAS